MSNFRSTLYSYDRYLENGLFEKLVVPEGIDKDLLIDTIMKECGEMCPVWTNPVLMVDMIGVWSAKWLRTFEKWLSAYNAEYNPIHNYDRHEDIHDETHEEGVSGHASTTTNTGTVTNTNTRSSYNSSTYQPHDKNTQEMEDVSTMLDGSTNMENAGKLDRTVHMYGNIGVTTTQQMLHDEYEIAKWNLYDQIKDLFMQEFLIMIY